MTAGIIFTFFLIFCGASVLATVALFSKQSLIVAYIILGALIGPWGFKFIGQTDFTHELASVGIVFLLFLLGLELQLNKLFERLKGAVIVTFVSSAIFGALSFAIAYFYGFSQIDCLLIGIAMMFSSTIISIKLVPSTVLYHQGLGKMLVSILLLQDFIAILVLLGLDLWAAGIAEANMFVLLRLVISLPLLVIFAVFFERWVLFKLLNRFALVKEYVFLIALGWCLGMAEFSNYLGASYEIGAFIAGVSLTVSPVSKFIADRLKPLRDFFLIVFFFSVGASVNFYSLYALLWPLLLLSICVLLVKPAVYKILLDIVAKAGVGTRASDNQVNGWELGARLGQASEFSLLVGFLAYHMMLISDQAFLLIQAVTVVSFIISSYFVGARYPNPLAYQQEL